MRSGLLSFLLLVCTPFAAHADDACPPDGTDAKSLQLLKEQHFAVAGDDTRDALAIGLLACLGNPDPTLRDGIAYEATSAWLRAKQLSPDLRRKMRKRLYAMLAEDDAQGFARPFAALVLSEIARTDRIDPWMSPKERAAMVAEATAYLASVRDYRGFDDAEGWRHGVAHGADWLLQLSLNPALDRKQLERILAAIASQAVPETPHAYVFGEPGRLARPVLYTAKRGLLSEGDWTAWFAALPARIGEPSKAYADSAWLARRHDLLAFLTAVHLEADQSDDPQIRALKAPVVAAMKTIP